MSKSFKISFVGDLCLHGIDVDKYSIDDELVKLLESSDICVANHEFCTTDSTSAMKHQPCNLKSASKTNRIMELFDVYSLANNHILDFMKEGLEDTLSSLESQKKRWFGAGTNERQANSPLIVRSGGYSIAFIGFTRWYNASRYGYGTASDNISRLQQTIIELKREGHFVVVCPHWNYEYTDYPSPIERNKAKKLIESGADIIVGAHPHVIQGFEQYKDKHIFHSLGNFIFHSSLFVGKGDRVFNTFVLTIEITPDHNYRFDITPVRTADSGIKVLKLEEKEVFLEQIRLLSEVFSDKRRYEKLFYQDSKMIIKKTEGSLRDTTRNGSYILGLLRRIFRVSRQDVYIKFHSLFQ